MNVSVAIADVQVRDTGPEATGDQKDCLPSRLVPLARPVSLDRLSCGSCSVVPAVQASEVLVCQHSFPAAS
jgi:hypothetical protein